ncbi:pilus assembly protein [Sandaracinobacter neustonicus]|uniref:Pilus assembly protein n=1 Tax=Sandaracinobacter neustonicus TaxID=1715348 RepID=A0A501XN11_9SPHN|nr:TadE/TadG family type IV pilus assembly protein [Sandaracinobacter neustonicus]TPE61825.1 pilus assembly protein [Sandaracinobacter neustonicus]
MYGFESYKNSGEKGRDMSLEMNRGAHPFMCAYAESVCAQSGRLEPRQLNAGGHGLLRRLRRRRDGAVAVEFALVLPVLMGLLFGTIEYGLTLFTYSSMQTAARDVTRQMAVNTVASGSAVTEIRNRLPGWMRTSATITVSQSAAGNAATNVYTTVVSVPMSKASPLAFYTKATSESLRTEVKMKQELPFTN